MAYATIAQLRDYLRQIPTWGNVTITLAGATGGTFALGYNGLSTGALAYNETAATIEAALCALVPIGPGGVTVAGPPGGPYLVEFQRRLRTDAAPLVATSSLTGSAPTVTVAQTADAQLQAVLDRATALIRGALRELLADDAFDYGAPVVGTQIVRGISGFYLPLPPHTAGSVTLVEYSAGYNPATYASLPDQWLEEGGRLFRAAGWLAGDRYRVTASWGYGATAPDQVVQLTLESAVNLWRSRDLGGYAQIVTAEGQTAQRRIAGLNSDQVAALERLASEIGQVAL